MIAYFIRNSKLVSLITVAIIIGGIMSLFSLRRESFPNVDFAQAVVKTFYPGATPEDVEIQVTTKIEDALREIEGIKKIRSVSQEGYSEVNIIVDIDNVDSRAVLDEIQRAVDKVSGLPKEIPDPPLFAEMKTNNMPVLEVSVLGDVDERELRRYADYLEDIFGLNEGVAKVNKIGYRDREYRVFVDPIKMESLHISFAEVIRAVGGANINTPGGIFESRPTKMAVRTVGEIGNLNELLDVVVRTNLSGQVVRVRDIATVEDTYETPRVLAKTNGKPSVILVVMKKEHADIINLTEDLKDEVNKFRKSLPKGMEVLVSNDESKRTRNRLDIITSNSLLGFVFLIVSLVMFLDIKNAVLTSFAAPIVILLTLMLMGWFGLTFNMISMLAIIIALGMFVDNSIVISENIFRLKDKGIPIMEAAEKGTQEIWAPITATVLTTIAAFMPMLVTSGIMGQFIMAIPIMVSCSLLASLADSFFLLPARIVAFNRKTKIHEAKWFESVREMFESILRFFLSYKWLTLLFANLLLVGALVFAFKKLDFILFPAEGVDRFAVKYLAKAGTPIEDVHKGIARVENELMNLPEGEIVAVTTRTGIQQMGIGDPLSRSGDNVGMMIVYLTDEIKRARTATEIMDGLRQTIKPYAPFEMIQFEGLAMGPPVGKAVTVSIQGEGLDVLKVLAGRIRSFLGDIDGVKDLDQDLKPGLKQLRVEIKRGVSEDIGLTVGEIAVAIRTAHEGVIASTLRKYGDDIDIRVIFSKKARGDRDALRNLLISDTRGNLIPLHKVANVFEEPGPETRRHYNYMRSITITADVDTSKNTSMAVNSKLRKEFGEVLKDYPGYRLKFGGEEESTNESMASLARAMVFSIIGIFSILVALFGSYLKPFLIMYSIPFGFVGTIIGFSFHDKPFGFLAMIGLIGLAGVVVNSAIVLVSFIDMLREEGELDFTECLVKGAGLRLRPIILTTLTTVSALFPTAYSLGGWDPMLVPMTLAMAWGLLFGTGLTLVTVPCAYAAMESFLSATHRLTNR